MRTIKLATLFGIDRYPPSDKAVSTSISYLMSEGYFGTIQSKHEHGRVSLIWLVPEVTKAQQLAINMTVKYEKSDRRYLFWEEPTSLRIRRPIQDMQDSQNCITLYYNNRNTSVTRAFQVGDNDTKIQTDNQTFPNQQVSQPILGGSGARPNVGASVAISRPVVAVETRHGSNATPGICPGSSVLNQDGTCSACGHFPDNHRKNPAKEAVKQLPPKGPLTKIWRWGFDK